MSRMTKPLMAAVAVILSAALLTCAGGSPANQTGTTATPTAAPTAQSAPINPFFTGDGGKGKSITILPPRGVGLAANQAYLPDFVANELLSNFKDFSAMTLFDRVNNQRQYDELLSGYYADDDKAGLDLGHLTSTDYMLLGNITKTSTGFALQLTVNSNSDKTTAASYSATVSIAELDNLTGVRKASLDLLQKMGVQVTAQAQTELSSAAAASHVIFQSSLARGITAERSGANVEALAQYMQAAALDSSSAEINARLSNTSQKVFTGDLKSGLQNEIQQKRAWLQILNDCAKAYDNVMPFQFQIGRLRVGKVDMVRETQEFYLYLDIQVDSTPMKLLESVLEEYLKLGYEKMLEYGFINSLCAGWPTSNSPSGARIPAVIGRNRPFDIVIALVNEKGKEFRQNITLTGRIDFELADLNPSYYGSNVLIKRRSDTGYSLIYLVRDKRGDLRNILITRKSNRPTIQAPTITISSQNSLDARRVTFNMHADDLTDTYTLKIISINGIDADTFALTNNMRISTSTSVRNIVYDEINGAIIIIKADQYASDVIIPERINGLPVVRIEWLAFADSELTRITIGADVKIDADVNIGAEIKIGELFHHKSFIGFAAFYDKNKKKAGTYTYDDKKGWQYKK